MHDIMKRVTIYSFILFLTRGIFVLLTDKMMSVFFLFFDPLLYMLQQATSINGLQSTDHENGMSPPVNTFKVMHKKSTMMPSTS